MEYVRGKYEMECSGVDLSALHLDIHNEYQYETTGKLNGTDGKNSKDSECGKVEEDVFDVMRESMKIVDTVTRDSVHEAIEVVLSECGDVLDSYIDMLVAQEFQ